MPRFVFTDLPLGNPVGPPDDADGQLDTLRTALTLAERAWQSRITVQAERVWTGDRNWRETYMALDDPDDLRRRGQDRRARQEAARSAAAQSPS